MDTVIQMYSPLYDVGKLGEGFSRSRMIRLLLLLVTAPGDPGLEKSAVAFGFWTGTVQKLLLYLKVRYRCV